MNNSGYLTQFSSNNEINKKRPFSGNGFQQQRCLKRPVIYPPGQHYLEVYLLNKLNKKKIGK